MSIEDKIKNAKNTYWITDGIPKEEVDDIIEKERNKISKKHKDIISEMTNLDNCTNKYPIYAIDPIETKIIKIDDRSHAEHCRLFGYIFYSDRESAVKALKLTKELNELISKVIAYETKKYIEDNFIEVKKLKFGEHAEFSIDKSQ